MNPITKANMERLGFDNEAEYIAFVTERANDEKKLKEDCL